MAFFYNETNNKFATETWNSPSAGPGFAKGPITVTQDGLIRAPAGNALTLNGGVYTLTVNGQISGNAVADGVSFGPSPTEGVNKVTVGEAGNIYGGTGVYSKESLVVTNAGTVGGNAVGIYLDGDDPDTLNVVNTGTIWTGIPSGNNAILSESLGGGSVTNSGSILGNVNFLSGTVKVTNSTTGKITGSLLLGGNSNTVSNAGVINFNVETFDGDDVVTNSGTIGGYVNFRTGNNKFTNSGTVEGNFAGFSVIFGDNNDTMTNSGTLENGDVNLGNGINSLTNKGTINGDIVGGIGTDKVTNSGSIVGQFFLGDGANSLTNSGVIGIEGGSLSVLGGLGADAFTNSGKIYGFVDTGDGKDVVKNTGEISLETDLGDGDDSYTGGNFIDRVVDGEGKDTFVLGGGDDLYLTNLVAGVNDGLGDKVDGGSNKTVDFSLGLFGDTYDASGSSVAVNINADAAAKTSLDDVIIPVGTTLAKGTATGTNVGLDFISNFETFRGSSALDIIFGDAKANGIFGNAGTDRLHGGGGNDWIDGGLNNDRISGDGGADTLTGGSGGFDDFIYHKLSDSTVGKSGRDVIVDFGDFFDQFDFRKINPLSNMHLNAFDFTDASFDGTAGAVRMLFNLEGWLLQVDANGDKKVDMSIQVNDASHVIVWDSTDFIFT